MLTKIVPASAEGINAAIEELQSGEVVALPTETVYGLAADVTNLKAIAKIFAAKDRPLYDPLIVHVPSVSLDWLHEKSIVDLEKLAPEVREKVSQLVDRYWPGPLTILLPRGEGIGDLVTSGSDMVAVRSPAHPVFQQILTGLGHPLAAPSANRFGHVSPTSAQHVIDDLDGRIPLIVDGGAAQVGVESTIIKVNELGFELLRPGGLAIDHISAIVGKDVTEQSSSKSKLVITPGSLEKHYAPDMRVQLFAPGMQVPSYSKGVLLVPQESDMPSLPKSLMHNLEVRYLTFKNCDAEAAQNIYSFLRLIESDTVIDLLLVVLPKSDDGLWPAIRDRLRRATAQ